MSELMLSNILLSLQVGRCRWYGAWLYQLEQRNSLKIDEYKKVLTEL